MPSKRFQIGLLVPADQFLLKLADQLGSLLGRRGDLGDDVLGHTGRRQLFGRRHDRFEQGQVAAGECLDQHLGCLFGRDLLPAVDLALLDLGDPRAAGVEPAAFVEAPVAVEVFLAVDLESVLVIAPLIEFGLPCATTKRRSNFPWPSRKA